MLQIPGAFYLMAYYVPGTNGDELPIGVENLYFAILQWIGDVQLPIVVRIRMPMWPLDH